ncbi:hypothetical protein NT2_09_00110 [Caenibius tardaugens NBRC 16725]|uniref:SnoaL-like domain-containing protein n=1 Tax=Caenibius tardaugens NBRC 16725 TaxID=1219035 RepID=U3A6N9_9SPHN|nr:nuclear transport factor 2 family protein [Caenibius tardaugens]GAD50403.1 hypothetical protein NT2_09_00110 [Caenibius tardaugens NBRC 16725]
MSENLEKSKRWLDILARGAGEEWAEVAHPDLSMQAPFMPAGRHGRTTGIIPNRDRVTAFWKSWDSFRFHSVDIHAAADDNNLVFVTASSEARTAWGSPYENKYVIILRFADGKVIEHLEFLNPLPVIEAFGDRLAPKSE